MTNEEILKNWPPDTGVQLIAKERQRQIEVEGWTPEHDSTHKQGELAKAAACYSNPIFNEQKVSCQLLTGGKITPEFWPWDEEELLPPSNPNYPTPQ